MQRVALTGLLVAFALPAAAAAQGGPGFLFREPRVTLKFEAGYGVQAATGEYFDYTREKFTVDWRDFDAPYLGGELAYRATPRWDVAFGVGFAESSVESETREFIGSDDLPIVQTTELRLIPITLSAKYYLRDRGRRVGRFAWVPNAMSPYVGGGVGILSYDFEQRGDFVNEETLDIYYDRLKSDGNTPMARALAGLSLSLGRQLELTGEARYTFARADMSRQFGGFGPMDLNGLQVVAGIAVRF